MDTNPKLQKPEIPQTIEEKAAAYDAIVAAYNSIKRSRRRWVKNRTDLRNTWRELYKVLEAASGRLGLRVVVFDPNWHAMVVRNGAQGPVDRTEVNDADEPVTSVVESGEPENTVESGEVSETAESGTPEESGIVDDTVESGAPESGELETAESGEAAESGTPESGEPESGAPESGEVEQV